jgi:hypothetical protein
MRGSITNAAANKSSGPPGLKFLGFRPTDSGVHTARTMLLPDLGIALEHFADGPVDPAAVRTAIVQANLLARGSMNARRVAAQCLLELYGFDEALPVFRALRALWFRDPSARPALGLLVAMARDGVLRGVLPFARSLGEGERFDVKELASFLRRRHPGRFSDSTVRSVARNVASSWTQAGLLSGVVRKTRRSIPLRPTSLAMALFLAYLEGARGTALFTSPWVGIFDDEPDALRDAALEANRLSLLRMAALDTVVEVSFPHWLRPDERRWLDEHDQAAAG